MATHILTWNPDTTPPSTDDSPDWWEHNVDETLSGRAARDDWSVAHRVNGIHIRDSFYLLLQGDGPRGLVGHGYLESGPSEPRDRWDEMHLPEAERRQCRYVDIALTEALDFDDRLDTELLLFLVPEIDWNHIQSSGHTIPDNASQHLNAVWNDHIDSPQEPEHAEEEGYWEGHMTITAVNRYERIPAARKACIAAHGHSCSACGMDFESVYGKVGRGFIEVHHLVPLASLGRHHAVDPVKDMRPLCPNCHAMVHRQNPPMDPKDLKRLLSFRSSDES